MSKNLVIKKNKLFWLFIVLGAIVLLFGVTLLPVWKDIDIFFASWSDAGVNIVLFAILVFYIVLLINRNLVKRKSKFIVGITIIELIVLLFVAVSCLLQQFNVFSIFGPCFVFGLMIYFRGLVNVLEPYFSSISTNNSKARLSVLVSIILLTVGAIMMVIKVPNNIFNWIIAITILLVAVLLILFGILSMPKKEKK